MLSLGLLFAHASTSLLFAPALVLPQPPARARTVLPAAFATSDTTVLVGPRSSACGVSTLERHPDLPLARLRVVGTPVESVVDDDIYAFIALMEELFERPASERFTILWDCREGAFPSLRQLKIGFKWLNEDGRTAEWDRRVAGNAVLLSNPLLRVSVQAAIAIARPPTPVHVSKDPDRALEFAKALGGAEES